MLRVSSVSKAYGAEPVLHDVSFVLNAGERVGLIGANGSGKSTLLRLISGLLVPDTGSVWLSPGSRAEYLPQYPIDELDLSIRDSLRRGTGTAGEAQLQIEQLEPALQIATGKALEMLLAEYSAARETFERLGGYALEARIDHILAGLSLDATDMDARVRTLSGGNRTKLSLARLLLSGANVLLLDEPTNYLDLPALLWLEQFVAESAAAYLIVSHDRRFLDRTVTSIFELDTDQHTLRIWPGGYSDYAEARLREEQKRLEAYLDQQAEIKRIEEDIRRTKEQARGVEARTKSGMGADQERRYAKKVARKAKSRERRLEKQLDSADMIDKPRKGWNLHLADLGGDGIDDQRSVLEIKGVRAGYDGREVLRGIDLLVRGSDRVALLGENGSGKSTLVRCLTGQLSSIGSIKIGPSIRLGVLSQEAEELPLDRTVLEVFRSRTEMHEAEARTYLHRFLFSGDQALRHIGSLSYGQRAKLALAILLLSGANFLVLDEPTSHLDMPALEAVERAVESYLGPMLLISHDRYFLERVGVNRVEIMVGGRLKSVASVEQYEQETVRHGPYSQRTTSDPQLFARERS